MSGVEPYLVGIVALVLVVTLIVYLTMPPSPMRELRPASTMMTITNPSSQTKTVEISEPHTRFDLDPGAITTAVVAPGATVSTAAVNFDGSVTRRSLRLSSTLGVIPTMIYTTEDAVHTDLTAKPTALVNLASHATLFIEIGSEGRRCPKSMVPPGESCPLVIVAVGSTWEVVDPKRENHVLDRTRVNALPGALVFDGELLVAR